MFNLKKLKKKTISFVVLTIIFMIACYVGRICLTQDNEWYAILNILFYYSYPLLFVVLYNLIEVLGALKRLDIKDLEYELKEEQVYYPNIKTIITKNYLLIVTTTLHIFRIDELEYFYYELCRKNTKNVHYAIDIIDNKKKIFTHRVYLGYLLNPNTFAESLEIVQNYLTSGNANIVIEKTEEFKSIQKKIRHKELVFRILLLVVFLIYLNIITEFWI